MTPTPDRRTKNAAAIARLRAEADRLERLAQLPGRRVLVNVTDTGVSAFVSVDASPAKAPCPRRRRVG